MRDLRAARPYARAVFELARQEGREEVLERQLRLVADLWDRSAPLRRFLTHPQLDRAAKHAALLRLLGDRLDELGRRVLDLVLAHDRAALLPAIHAVYRRLWDEERGVVQAVADSAVALTDAQRDELAGALSRSTGKTVELTVRTDPALVGGVVVRVGDRILDGSMVRRLARLRERLRGGSGGGYAFEH
ncbi:MAG: F0F1 ATP synthase subunit delta [Thermaerobacter sp.]|nr:F0F1 ATP synthase subunit delta [Thermaerobacter sp.]